MAVLLRKMLGIGKLPDDMRAEVESEGVLHLAEFVPVTFRFTGTVPAAGTRHAVVGAPEGRPRRRPPVARGARVHGDGDARRVGTPARRAGHLRRRSSLHGCGVVALQGTVVVDVLTQLPQRSFVFDVPPKFVYSIVGVPCG